MFPWTSKASVGFLFIPTLLFAKSFQIRAFPVGMSKVYETVVNLSVIDIFKVYSLSVSKWLPEPTLFIVMFVELAQYKECSKNNFASAYCEKYKDF